MTGSPNPSQTKPLLHFRADRLFSPATAASDKAERIFHIDADFARNGTWSGVRDLVAIAYLELSEMGRDSFLEGYDYELHRVLPEYRDRITLRHACLTDNARGSERTRNFPLDRAYRLVHGLIEMLLTWKRASAPKQQWIVIVQNFSRAQHISTRFVAELARRGAAADVMFKVLIDDAAPVDGLMGMNVDTTNMTLNDFGLTPIPSLKIDKAALDAISHQLQSNDILEWEIHYPSMLASAIARKDILAQAKISLRALCICNHYGYYHESASFADDVLPFLDEIVGDDEEARWNCIGNIYQGLVTTGGEDRAREIVLIHGEPRISRVDLRARMHYLLSMSYLRYTQSPDLALAEQHITQAVIDILAANGSIPQNDYNFLKVFIDNGLAFLRVRQGRQTEALALCQEGYQSLTGEVGEEKHKLHRSVLQYNTAQVFAMLGKHEEALNHYHKSIEMDPYYSEYYNEVGNILQRLERYEEANDMYGLAIAYSAPYPEVHHNIGICQSALGKTDLALISFDRSLEMNPFQADLYAARAELLENEDLADEALASYSIAIALSPDHVAARVNRAVLNYDAGRFEDALADMNHVISLEPDRADHYLNRAEIYKSMTNHRMYRSDVEFAQTRKSIEYADKTL